MSDSAAPDLARPLKIVLLAGEHSGDQLGFKLMLALRRACPRGVEFKGVGGEAMAAQGFVSLFPLADIAVMGFLPVLRRLPTLLARIRAAADAIAADPPDVLVLIDSPDFTHRVARRVRHWRPQVPIIDYVSPTVWAWRPGRARAMRAYVDHVLALLPFEPAAHQRLGGPPCTYVGHPLIERLAELRPDASELAGRLEEPPLVLVLPGSRRAEIERLMRPFGEVVDRLERARGPVDFVLPAVSHLDQEIRAHLASWPTQPRIVLGEAAKLAAFRRARAALAASGTVTLELALGGVPMVVGYAVSRLEELVKYVITVSSIVLPNLILGRRAVPELLQRDCTPDRLYAELLPLLVGGEERDRQLAAFAEMDALMQLPDREAPSDCAAAIVVDFARNGRQAR